MPSARIELPITDFLYTLDQLAMLLGMTEEALRAKHIFFDGRTTGSSRSKMLARNIAADDATPDWRVSSTQFRLYLRRKGYSIVERQVL